MADKLGVETLSELQIWIEGKFELISQAQKANHVDLTTIRQRVHDLAGEIAKVAALNLPSTIADLKEADHRHQQEIARFITEAAERKGALATLKALYTIIGALVGGAIALLLKLYEVFQP